MNSHSAQSFLADQMPVTHRVLLPPVLKTAYNAVNIIVANEPILQVPSAQDHKGRLVSWAVDLGLVKLIESGRWPVDYRWRSFGVTSRKTGAFKPTGQYLQIVLSHSTMTVSQVADPTKQPRDVKFRENARLINEPFIPELDVHNEVELAGEPSILLVHGHQSLNFAHFGIPHAHRRHAYIYRSENLLRLPHELPSDVHPVEKTDYEDTMTLKEEIEKWRKDHGG